MKTIWVLLLVGLLAFSTGFSQDSEWETLELYDLKGKVKSFEEKKFVFVFAEGQLEKQKCLGNSSCHSQKVHFNIDGNATVVEGFDLNGKPVNKGVVDYNASGYPVREENLDYEMGWYSLIYKKYDKEDRLTEELLYENGRLLYSFKMHYGENQKLKESYWLKSNGTLHQKTIFIYNKDTLLVESKGLGPAGTLRFETRMSYDSSGRILNRSEVYSDDIIPNLTQKYNYDVTGVLIGMETTQDEETRRSIFKYDDYGKIAEDIETIITPIVTYTSNHTFEYEYDRQGNWFKKTQFLDGDPVLMWERVIEYY